jgi:NADPH2:quinone reductase
MKAGSIYLTRPTLADYVATPEQLAISAKKLFDRIAKGILKPHIGQTFRLEEAAEAHRALESRATTGSTILVP